MILLHRLPAKILSPRCSWQTRATTSTKSGVSRGFVRLGVYLISANVCCSSSPNGCDILRRGGTGVPVIEPLSAVNPQAAGVLYVPLVIWVPSEEIVAVPVD